MKIILILLAIVILISKVKSMKTLFKSREKRTEQLKQVVETSKENAGKDTDIFNLVMYVLMGLFSLLYILFYILSGVYINNFWFVIISVLLIIDTIRNYFKSCEFVIDVSKCKADSTLYLILNFVIDISYIGYVLFTIYTNW